jgi:hypothetical protein
VIKELEALKKRCEPEDKAMLIEIAKDMVAVFLYMAHCIKDTPMNEQLAQCLACVELSVEKSRKRSLSRPERLI